MSGEEKNKLIKKLLTEKHQLSNKIRLLNNFIGSEKWEEIGSIQAMLLDTQLNIMKSYNDVLSTRIIVLKSEE